MSEKESGKKEKAVRRLREIFLFPISRYSIIALISGVLLNMAGQRLASSLDLPFWLDTTGTMAVAIGYGPLAGMLVGGITNIMLSIFDSFILSYIVIAMMVGLVIGLYFSRKKKPEAIGVVSVGILTAIISVLISIPIDVVNFNGQTGNLWGDAFYDMVSGTISNTFLNAVGAKLFLEIPDKVLTLLLAVLIVKGIEHLSSKGSPAKTAGKTAKKVLLFLTAIGLTIMQTTGNVDAEELDADFETVIFRSSEGILTAEVNAVAQTSDGYIWAGTYSGLYKYDGVRFREVEIDERIKNVMKLFVDSSGRLWIGTNDSGVVCFDPMTGEKRIYSTDNGLTADSIRAISEDVNGNIFIGTARYVSRIAKNGNLKTYSEWDDVFYAQDFAALPTGEMVGVTNGGVLFMLKDDILMDTETYDRENGIYYRRVSRTDGGFLVGTSGNTVDMYTTDRGNFVHSGSFSIRENAFINDMEYSDEYKGFFVCCEDGMGFFDEKDHSYTNLTRKSVAGAVSDVCVDDQSNIWFASSKYGLVKYSRSPFLNLFNRARIDTGIVNAIYKDGDTLYVGMDSGLQVLDMNTCRTKAVSYADKLNGVRIRNINKDSKGNLWFSTYGEDGLLRVDPSGKVTVFNDKSGGMLGGRCRCAIELSDGRMLAASNMGLSFIQGDQVVATIGVDDGLNNQYILSMYEKEDGSILAASDGDGIYVIRNDRVAGHIGKSEGLDTAVVLKIIPCSGGFLYVTSNALYYDNGSGVRQLKNFPYSNNYDILITDDGMCWITSSAGLYIVSEAALIADGDYTCTLLDESWGLTTSFTANSFSVLDGDTMYLCCVDGVRQISTTDYNSYSDEFQMHLSGIERGDEVFLMKNGEYVITPGSGRISFNVAVNNYSLSNPLIRYYLEGSDDEGVTCFQNEIQPLSFTNLPLGEYRFHIQVLDSTDGSVKWENVYPVIKQSRMYERTYFRVYLYILSVLLIVYVVWLFITINRKTRSIIGLQTEISTDKMTGLLNKAGATRTLEKLCEEETGIFMMIDLDSFKLVNDIHGHEMGDRILIRFAELIREALGEENIAGRIGGDEFVGFIRNTTDVERVAEITTFLNRELVKSAKEYMGEDMNIPLGTSIGAVRCPSDGTDYHELFKLADKALYVVKQNGKHSYSFYQSSGNDVDLDKEKKDKNNLEQIRKIIGERNEGKGAFLVNFDRLQVLYKYLSRNSRATSSGFGFLRFTIENSDGKDVPDDTLDSFEERLITGLKKNDVVSRYSGSFFVLLTGAEKEDCEGVAERMIKEWLSKEENGSYRVAYEMETG